MPTQRVYYIMAASWHVIGVCGRMAMRYRIFNALGALVAGQFSLLCVGAVAAAGSVALFAAHEHKAFGDWSSGHYAAGDKVLAANKLVKLPPIDDAIPMSLIVHTADDAFSSSLRSGKVFRGSGKTHKSSKYIRKVKRSNLIGRGSQGLFFEPFGTVTSRPKARRTPQSGLYRTMCVRSCDGFMWPISFSTTKTNFNVDKNICRSSCAAPTRLYHYENPGQEPADMIDDSGRLYNSLPTAWRYQQQHVSSCKCRPDPWEAQAMARHTKYASLKQQGLLKSFLRKESRKAKRLSRRASIGFVVTNSSFSTVESSGLTGNKPKVTRLQKASKRRKSRSRASSAFGGSRGFGAPTSKKSYSKPKAYSSRSRRSIFRKAFGVDR